MPRPTDQRGVLATWWYAGLIACAFGFGACTGPGLEPPGDDDSSPGTVGHTADAGTNSGSGTAGKRGTTDGADATGGKGSDETGGKGGAFGTGGATVKPPVIKADAGPAPNDEDDAGATR